MKLTIKYKNQTKETVRNNIERVSMTKKDFINNSIYVTRKGNAHGTYYSLKDMVFFDVDEED